MATAVLEREGILGGVGGFDADKARPDVCAEVGKSARLGLPRIPDDGGLRALLADEKQAVGGWIVDGAKGGRGKIKPVRFALEFDGLSFLTLPEEVVHLVDVLGALQSDDPCMPDIANGEVGVERFLVRERL